MNRKKLSKIKNNLTEQLLGVESYTITFNSLTLYIINANIEIFIFMVDDHYQVNIFNNCSDTNVWQKNLLYTTHNVSKYLTVKELYETIKSELKKDQGYNNALRKEKLKRIVN